MVARRVREEEERKEILKILLRDENLNLDEMAKRTGRISLGQA